MQSTLHTGKSGRFLLISTQSNLSCLYVTVCPWHRHRHTQQSDHSTVSKFVGGSLFQRTYAAILPLCDYVTSIVSIPIRGERYNGH